MASRGRRVFAQAVGTVGLNGATLAFNLVVALLLSRLLGPHGYGAYAFAAAWSLLLSVPAMLGLTQLVVREIATYRVREDWRRARGLLRRANQAVVAASLVLAGGTAAVFALLHWPTGPLFEPALLGLLLVPLIALVTVRQSAMQGFGAVVLARVPEALVAPVLMIGFVLLFDAWRGELSANTAVTAQILGAGIAAVVGLLLLRRTLPGEVKQAERLDETRLWLIGALPILVASGIQAVNVQAGTILTGSLAGSGEAGIYGVGVRVAGFLPFLLLAAVPALMPTIAELHERAELDALQRLLTRAARFVFLGSLPLVLGTILLARPILGLFGGDFGPGVTVLRILAVGQLVNVATGLAGMILVMIGEAGRATWAVAVGTLANLVLCATLIPPFGADGAAVATTASLVVTNSLMAVFLWRGRGIRSTAFQFPVAASVVRLPSRPANRL